jgi:hypothetical protein
MTGADETIRRAVTERMAQDLAGGIPRERGLTCSRSAAST